MRSINRFFILFGSIFFLVGAAVTAVGFLIRHLIKDAVQKQGAQPEAAMIPFLLGGIFAVVGAVFLVVALVGTRKEQKLRASGTRTTAYVTAAREQTNIRINGRHPIFIDCRMEDPLTGEVSLFASKGVMDERLYDTVGMPVDVYYDPSNPKKNFVDVEGLLVQMECPSKSKIHDYR